MSFGSKGSQPASNKRHGFFSDDVAVGLMAWSYLGMSEICWLDTLTKSEGVPLLVSRKI